MEVAVLYTVAAKYKAKALGILTISDSLVTGELTTAKEREQSFGDMVKVGLETLLD
jgi:purine-nucleoside phosphorylase